MSSFITRDSRTSEASSKEQLPIVVYELQPALGKADFYFSKSTANGVASTFTDSISNYARAELGRGVATKRSK